MCRRMASSGATSMRALSMEFKALQREPVEGFRVTIPNDSDFYTWQVAIFGPPDTPYQGGYFKVGVFVSGCGLADKSFNQPNPLSLLPSLPLSLRLR